MPKDKSKQLFISYSTKEESFVSKLVTDLQIRKLQVWYDKTGVRGGDYILEKITSAISKSKYFIVILSPNSVKSKWVKFELMQAYNKMLSKDKDLKIISLLYKKCEVPKYLESNRIISFTEDYHKGLKELLVAIDFQEKKIITIERPEEERKTPFLISTKVDIELQTTDIRHELETQFQFDKEIDQKFLYWSVEAVKRWIDICYHSDYKLQVLSNNFIINNVDDIISSIKNDCQSKLFDFMDLGVGYGQKDYTILSNLVDNINESSIIHFYPIDLSFPMLQHVYEKVKSLMMHYSKNLKVHGLIGDILRLHWYNDFFRRSKNPKIVGFLGGSLGNFEEDAVLKSISKFMEPCDYLILGIEYISDREDDELIAEYSDKKNKQFVIGPLLDLAVMSLSKVNWDRSFKFRIKKNYNDVKNSKTVISEYTYKKSEIMLSYSTKYNKLSLLKYLKDKGFTIVFEKDTSDNRYGNIILKKK